MKFNMHTIMDEFFYVGMLLRLFMDFYDMEVVEEEVFLRWKEEVNDEYPGKGKALFQVRILGILILAVTADFQQCGILT